MYISVPLFLEPFPPHGLLSSRRASIHSLMMQSDHQILLTALARLSYSFGFYCIPRWIVLLWPSPSGSLRLNCRLDHLTVRVSQDVRTFTKRAWVACVTCVRTCALFLPYIFPLLNRPTFFILLPNSKIILTGKRNLSIDIDKLKCWKYTLLKISTFFTFNYGYRRTKRM